MAVSDNVEMAAATSPAAADEICYRCKNTGHRAKDCPTKKTKQQQPQSQTPSHTTTPAAPSPANATTTAAEETKLCYRCKQAGHLASACPDKKRTREAETAAANQPHQPRPEAAASATSASAEQCYRCQQLGHRASACPTKKKQKTADAAAFESGVRSSAATVDSSSSATAGRRCYMCKSADHLSSACPNKDRPHTTASRPQPPPASTSRTPAIKPCYRCYATTHSTIDCPVPKHCHYCESPAHLAADCPDKRSVLRQREREKAKACNRCGETGHIERECPTLPHRRVWRQEGKERAMGCYVCGSVEHYAMECAEVTGLESRVKDAEGRWEKGGMVSENECERLLVSCAAALEYRGAVWLLQQMSERAVAVTSGGWEAMERLHSVSGKDQSRIEVAAIKDIKKPKQLLAAHIKQHRATQRHTLVQSHLAAVVEAIVQLTADADAASGSGGVVVAASAFALCSRLREKLGEDVLSAKESREAVMALVKDRRLKKSSKGVVWRREASGQREEGGEHDEPLAAGVEDEKEKRRRMKRAQEKKRKAAKKQKLATTQQRTPAVVSAPIP